MDNNVKIISQDTKIITPPVVGSAHKEGGPIGIAEIRPSGAEISPDIHQELEDLGVKETQDKPVLTQEHAGIIEHAGASVPVPDIASSLPQSSLTRKQIKSISIGRSLRWWEELIYRIIKITRLKERMA